jgi:hypothetical protein
MNNATKTFSIIAVGLVLLAILVQEAFAAIRLSGMVPVGKAGLVILQANKMSATTDTLRFKFSAPAFNAGVAYALDFCIGPASNPCGLPTSYVVNVPGGQERLAVVPASIFTDNVLTVGQGTKVPVPFVVTME